MIIDIYQDSKGLGQCRSCGARIEWAETVNKGARMPFNAPIVAVRTQDSLLLGRVIESVDTTVTKTHWETCPSAQQWKLKR